MNVLIVGGAGRVGEMVAGVLARDYRVRVADLRPALAAESMDVVPVDVMDVASLSRAVDGQDAVVYLAMGRREGWGTTGGWAESHFDVNVKGLYLTLRTAAGAGIGKAVYASSLSIFESYLTYGHELQDREPDAVDGYGLTKRLGEQVCEAAAREHRMGVVSLRLCAPTPDDEFLTYTGRRAEIRTAASDVAAAFAAALSYPVNRFEAFVVCGDHEEQSVTWSRTRDRLGWAPKMRRQPDR